MPNTESFLPDDLLARLRAPVELRPGARARVMQRVRAIAAFRAPATRPRGMARPSIVGALLAASFVAAVVTGGLRSEAGGDASATLADTLAATLADSMWLRSSAAEPAEEAPPAIDHARLVAVADETRIPATDPRRAR